MMRQHGATRRVRHHDGKSPELHATDEIPRETRAVFRAGAVRAFETRKSRAEEEHMYWILLIVIGGIIGWLASMVMNRDASMGIFANIIVGIIGSFIGNAVLSPFFGGSIGVWPPSFIALLGAFVGAVILLAIINLFTRRRVR